MAEWTTESIENCLSRLSLGTLTKLQTREYKAVGRYPVIDQGQSFIAGWTDDDSGLISSNLPVVVFGDHTRALKFVDFPFVRGADGTQVLKPRDGIDPLFFYYACKSIDLPPRGYNRHFTVLKEKSIPIPPPSEQSSIASVLRLIDECLEIQTDELLAMESLKRTSMRELFTRGLLNEAQKETAIGLVPISWDVELLGAHHTVGSGGTPSRNNEAYWIKGTIPWVKTTEVNYGIISETEEYITPEGLRNSAAKVLPVGTLLMAMYGQGVTRAKVAILGIEAACNQACATITSKDSQIDPQYLFHFLTYRYDDIRRLAHGGQQQNLNLDIVRDLIVSAPSSLDEQHAIVEILDAVNLKIDLHKRKRAVLEDLFAALLHKLMTGEIRVADLDLSALSEAPLEGVAA